MSCDCLLAGKTGNSCCERYGRVMGDRQREQCAASQAFRDGFAALPSSAACGEYTGPARGLGDTIERGLKAVGIHQAVKAVAKAVGKPCRCGERRDRLNEAVPYRKGDDALPPSPPAAP